MEAPGLAHFITQADAVGQSVLAILLAMSLASWTLIVLKLWQLRADAGARRRFLAGYRGLPTPWGLEKWLLEEPPAEGLGRLAQAAFDTVTRWQLREDRHLIEVIDGSEFVVAALSLGIARERQRLDSGLTVLAIVASTAPFVGLLGTVLGIYHALLAIGISGHGTLDQVAGPVGEALVMTAFGLAVAIPAVAAYNAFVRANRIATGVMEAFAHEITAFFATGIQDAQRLPNPVAGNIPAPVFAGSH